MGYLVIHLLDMDLRWQGVAAEHSKVLVRTAEEALSISQVSAKWLITLNLNQSSMYIFEILRASSGLLFLAIAENAVASERIGCW